MGIGGNLLVQILSGGTGGALNAVNANLADELRRAAEERKVQQEIAAEDRRIQAEREMARFREQLARRSGRKELKQKSRQKRRDIRFEEEIKDKRTVRTSAEIAQALRAANVSPEDIGKISAVGAAERGGQATSFSARDVLFPKPVKIGRGGMAIIDGEEIVNPYTPTPKRPRYRTETDKNGKVWRINMDTLERDEIPDIEKRVPSPGRGNRRNPLGTASMANMVDEEARRLYRLAAKGNLRVSFDMLPEAQRQGFIAAATANVEALEGKLMGGDEGAALDPFEQLKREMGL